MAIFVIEKDGQPMTQGDTERVAAYADNKNAWAHREVTPLVRLPSERVMTYVSVSQLRLINSIENLQTYLQLLEYELEAINKEGTPPK